MVEFSSSCCSPPPPPPPLRERPHLIFVFPLPSSSAWRVHWLIVRRSRGLSQWLACMYRGEEEEADEDEEERKEEEEEDNDNDDDEEETITIERVCPLGRRRCSSILFLVDASLVRLCYPCSTLLIFLPIFCPLVSDQSSRWPFCVKMRRWRGRK